MLNEVQKDFVVQYVNGNINCIPVKPEAMHNPSVFAKLALLQRHRVNTVHLLTKKPSPIKEIVAVDIETTCLDFQKGVIRLIIVYSPKRQLVTEKVAEVAHLLKDATILKVFHNAPFDVTWLTAHGFPVVNYTDTMLMGQILHNTAKSNNTLQALVLEHLGVLLDKTIQNAENWHGEMTNQHKQYALKDSEMTYHLYHLLKKKIAKKQVEVVLDHENSMLPIVIELNYNGIPFDYGGWSTQLTVVETEMKTFENSIRHSFQIPTLNLSSPQQLHVALQQIGITLNDVKDETLAMVEHLHPLVADLRKYKKLKKLISTYEEKLQAQICEDGRLRGQWHVIGTDTSRMTCKEPNLQGLPTYRQTLCKSA